MTASKRGAGVAPRRSLSRVLYDVARLLEAADAPDDRRRRVLELLGSAVPGDQCALLELQGEKPSRIHFAPEPSADDEAELIATLEGLVERLAADRAQTREGALGSRPLPSGSTLAVPLVAFDEVIGILWVRRATGAFAERHLRVLAIVGGQLAAYLSMVRAHETLEERARELDEARRAALLANRAKDEFLAVVSHELKDPVASTLAWAHMMIAAGPETGGLARAGAAIERNARSLAKLVDDIQGLACVASAELRLDLRAIEPAHDLKVAIESSRPSVEWSALRSGGAAASRSPGWLALDSDASVLASAKISTSGTHVALRLDRQGAAVRAVPVVDLSHGHGPAAAVKELEPLRALEGIRVLLVDDDSDIREAFQSVLEHYGASVTAVGSAAAALAAFERSRPDVLLSDLGMPGENGYDLMRSIAARDAALPAAALTAFGELADRRQAQEAGFRMQLAKPIDVAALVAAVAALAGRSSQSTQPLGDAARL